MRRELHPVWRAAREAVEQALEPLGFRLHSESAAYGAFGSAACEYVRSDLTIELCWDGKDGWLFASQRRAKPGGAGVFGDAKPIAVPPPRSNPAAHTLPDGPLAAEYIDGLVAALVATARAA